MKSLLSGFLLLAFAAAHGQHAERCDPIPKEEWKPQAELERMPIDQGWKISRVKIENGCYEVYGRDAKGHKRETLFHPKTFEIATAPKK